MMYLEEIFIKDQQWIDRIGEKHINFSSRVNLLVGPNGSGKSSVLTLLQLLSDSTSSSNLKTICKAKECTVYYLNTELTIRSNSSGSLDQKNSVGHLSLRWRSHGQAMRTYWDTIDQAELEGVVFLIDEPEAGADYDCLARLIRTIRKSRNCQFIIATHHPLFWCMNDVNIITLGKDPTYSQKCLSKLKIALSNQ